MLNVVVTQMELAMSTTSPSPSTEQAGEQPVLHRKFVRVTSPEGSEFVHFEFAIGWPDLSAELTLHRDQFDEFCKKHQVEFLDPENQQADTLTDLANGEKP